MLKITYRNCKFCGAIFLNYTDTYCPTCKKDNSEDFIVYVLDIENLEEKTEKEILKLEEKCNPNRWRKVHRRRNKRKSLGKNKRK